MNGKMKARRITSLILIMVFTFISVCITTSTPAYAASKKPAKVTGVKVTAASATSLKITWKKAKKAKKYQIYRATKKKGKYKKIKTTKKTSFVNKNLKTGKKYFYKVRAVNGKKKGKFSAVKSGKAKKTASSNTSNTSNTNTSTNTNTNTDTDTNTNTNTNTTTASDAFTGDLIITAKEAVAKVGNSNVIFVDCTDSGAKTVKGAIAVSWPSIATSESVVIDNKTYTWYKIPEAAELATILGNFGLDKNKEIITLGHTTTGWGEDARVAWELRAAGYTNVKIVDGGIDAVIAAGAPTSSPSTPVPCKVTVDSIDKTHVVQTDDLKSEFAKYNIADVRAAGEYNGTVTYGEKNGGHIKGAVLVPYLDLFKSDGTLKSNKEITAMYEAKGFSKEDNIVTYCTGGIRSAYAQMVLEMCGFKNTFNYDQSYWHWSIDGEIE